jgi:hypothetical protein
VRSPCNNHPVSALDPKEETCLMYFEVLLALSDEAIAGHEHQKIKPIE